MVCLISQSVELVLNSTDMIITGLSFRVPTLSLSHTLCHSPTPYSVSQGSMISSAVSGVALGISYCFCTALGSLGNACCGNDKSSSDTPSITSGRKRSALLLLLSIGLALIFQYVIAPRLAYTDANTGSSNVISNVPHVGPYLLKSWNEGCQDRHPAKVNSGAASTAYNTADQLALQQNQCRGDVGVYRVSICSTLFFLLAAIAAKCKPTFNREVWPAKYVLFLFMVIATVFIPNVPLFQPIYMQFSRVGGTLFIIFQQIILIDIAYNWNEAWVGHSNQCEDQELNTGRKWLVAIVISAVTLFITSIVCIGVLFHFFLGCPSNTAFISITLIMIVITTVIQLTGEEASLLTSATIAIYATYLCYSAVIRNPNGNCNPRLSSYDVGHDTLSVVIGIILTLISLAWTGFSMTDEETLSSPVDRYVRLTFTSLVSFFLGKAVIFNYQWLEKLKCYYLFLSRTDEGDKADAAPAGGGVTGVAMGSEETNYGSTSNAHSTTPLSSSKKEQTNASATASWRLNIALAMASCWNAMVLTGWGSVVGNGNEANPQVSNVSMWMIIAAQWVCFALYTWSILAPRLFTGRDFS